MVSSHRLGTPLLTDITDNGSRMVGALIREELFLPFRSTKSGGYGADALQIRELIRMADRLTRRPKRQAAAPICRKRQNCSGSAGPRSTI
jgi:hypothetical protein